MKKILFAIFAVAALALTSCEGTKVSILDIDASQLDNTEYKCWKWTVKKSGFMDGTVYVWDTEYNVVVVLQEAYKTAFPNRYLVSLQKEAAMRPKQYRAFPVILIPELRFPHTYSPHY
jgi:hypothetical protein